MGSRASDLERLMLDLVNAERVARGLSTLQLETNLNLSAEEHSQWMLETDIFSHTGENGSSSTDRIQAADFDLSGSWRTAENIAIQSERGQAGFADDVENLHESLMNSDGHRANILNPDLEYIGIGIEIGNFQYSNGGTFESVIVTQNFAATQGDVDLDTGRIGFEVDSKLSDFNGDGTDDILWRKDDGKVGQWELNDGVATYATIGNSGLDWDIVGTGDFNGDGTDDILWRKDDGKVGQWELNDGVATYATIGNSGLDWDIA
ncbi:MAG: CAP domain-containing protein [Litoreibacter sp.]